MPNRYLVATPLLLLLTAPSGAAAAVLWTGDFETGDVSQWDTSTALKTGDRDNLVFVSDHVANGTKAAQITLRDDIIFEPYNQSRVEVKHVGLHTLNGEDSYFAWSFMVPADAEIRSNIGYWESTPSSKNTMTFFIEPGQGGTLLKFGTGDLGQTVRWTQKLELGVWHRVAIHNHWSQSQSDGKVDVWYDGAQVVTAATATKYNADKLFFQMGLHRSDPSPPVQVIYIDAALEADSQADILMPLPPLGMGGSGGAAGASGSAGAAGLAGLGGLGGAASGGTAAVETGGAGAGGANASGAGQPASGGMPAAAGSLASAGSTASGGGAATAPLTTASSDDSSGCAVGAANTSTRSASWAALGLTCSLLVRRRRRAASRAAR